jgi:hypothetical protein
VTYFVTKARYYPPYIDADDTFGEVVDDTPDYGSDLVVREEVRLGRDGKLELTLPLERDPEAGR